MSLGEYSGSGAVSVIDHAASTFRALDLWVKHLLTLPWGVSEVECGGVEVENRAAMDVA